MEISALTRSVIKRNHAILSPDGLINSNVPGWKNCTVNVIINEQMGANFCQTLITANKNCSIAGATKESQIFFYIIKGKCNVNINAKRDDLSAGKYVYIPIEKNYSFDQFEEGTQILSFHKIYQELEGYKVPTPTFGDTSKVEARSYSDDEALRQQVLLPDDFSFDMAINIFTYEPGGHLPMVETRMMEHGLFCLQGQGIYRLDQEWYPLKKGDSAWIAPYCPQWFTAIGKEPAVFIYFQNVNRFPTLI